MPRARLGPCWVRTALETADSGGTPAVTTGKNKPQLAATSRPGPQPLEYRGGGFEPLAHPALTPQVSCRLERRWRQSHL